MVFPLNFLVCEVTVTMAKLFPEWISEEQRRANPKYRAEFKVYDALARQLSDEWYVFYSRTWTWVEKSSRLRTRETDFIIAHPKCGIVLLEVKGGRIEVEDGQWLSTDRHGNRWEISPYEQVAIATLALERRLDEERPNPFRHYRFSTAVCFPDVDISANLSVLEAKHRRITLDARHMEELQQTLVEVMMDSNGQFDSPGEARILMLKELVAASWYIDAPKSIQIKDTENEIKRLTDSQFKLLYQLAPTARRLLVTGCAGSGKTMLAAEIARRMAQLNKQRILFTCYNRNLATWIRTSSFFVDNGLMMVSNYHKLCAEFARAAGMELPITAERFPPKNDPLFVRILPDILLESAEHAGIRFNTIIVDEGQDFLENWWTSLLLLLEDDGCLHVYYDSHQQLWGAPNRLPAEVTQGAVSIDLTENVRNTRSIHDLAMKFHPSRGAGYKALVELGTDPEFVPVPRERKEHQILRTVLERLTEDEKVPADEIAVLTPLSIVDGNSAWKPGKTLIGKYRLVHYLNPRPNEIFCSSIGAAKGLEFPVVIITEVHSPAIAEEISDYMAQLYVGVSRGRSHLIVLSAQGAFEKLWATGNE